MHRATNYLRYSGTALVLDSLPEPGNQGRDKEQGDQAIG